MESYVDQLKKLFDKIGIKTVTATDVEKGAYVVNQEQKAVLEKAGIFPGVFPDVEFVYMHVLNSSETLETSYYDSVREGSGRTPETRMGRDLVHWVNVGDLLMMATDVKSIFVSKLSAKDYETPEDLSAFESKVTEAYSNIDKDALLKKAKAAKPKPKKNSSMASGYERDPAVRAWAIIRSDYYCEVPGCNYEGFIKSDGTKYIEVHHIVSLGDNGEDIISNVAALCPNHHKEAHFSKDKKAIRKKLKDAIGNGT